VVQTTLKLILEPILNPGFSDNSYGFCPGRSQRQAVETAHRIVRTGKEYVVDIDLSKYFDPVHHDRLISRLSVLILDKQMLRLIGMTSRSGVMKDGLVSPTREGTSQRGPLSPLLSNVVLDELDKELERRGLKFCCYADDCNIFVGSQKAAKRVIQSVGHFIENKMKLKVNWKKSGAIEECQISRYDHHCGHDRHIRGTNEACDGESEGVNPAWCACVPGVRDRSDKQVVCRLVGILPDDAVPISAKEYRDPRQA
jgi:group II intron reverse transcriptase/maturase